MKIFEQKITIEGLNIQYNEVGDKQKPLLLFIHGWPMSLVTFKTIDPFVFINELAKYFYVVIPQLPGFFSSEPPKDLWNVEDYARFVHQFVKKLNLDRPIVMGKSFGGGVAAMLAYKYPADVNKLILVDSATLPERNKLFWFKIVKPFVIFGRWLIKSNIMPFILKRVLISKFTGVPKESIQKNNFRQYLIMVDIFLTYSRQFDPKSIQAPTLIVWGDKDNVTPFREARRLNETIPNSQLLTFEGGHLVFETQPGKVIGGIIEALAKM